MQKLRRLLLPASVLVALLVVAAVGIYAWYSLFRPCDVNDVNEASALLIGQNNRFDEIYRVTTAATRTSLVRPVALLQQIAMDTQEVDVPACLQTAQEELIGYMGAVISAFQAYGAGESDVTIRGLLRESNAHYDNFAAELEKVQECAPYCFP